MGAKMAQKWWKMAFLNKIEALTNLSRKIKVKWSINAIKGCRHRLTLSETCFKKKALLSRNILAIYKNYRVLLILP